MSELIPQKLSPTEISGNNSKQQKLIPYLKKLIPRFLKGGGQKATLAKNSKNVKKYFDHQNVVRKFDLHHTLHAQNYDNFQGFHILRAS